MLVYYITTSTAATLALLSIKKTKLPNLQKRFCRLCCENVTLSQHSRWGALQSGREDSKPYREWGFESWYSNLPILMYLLAEEGASRLVKICCLVPACLLNASYRVLHIFSSPFIFLKLKNHTLNVLPQSCASIQLTKRFRSFHRGTISFCSSKS